MLIIEAMRNIFTYFGLLILILVSCEQEEYSYVDTGEVSDVIINDGNFLTQVIREGEELAIEMYNQNTVIMKGGSMRDTELADMTNPFTLETSISSPILDGTSLSCSFVNVMKVSGSVMAYITYSMSGAEHGGGLVVVDYTDVENPVLVNEILFRDIDLNVSEIHHLGKRIWLGGSSNKTGAVIIPLDLNSDGSVVLDNGLQSVFDLVKIKGVASVNGIVEAGDWIMVTAGNSNGGTWAINFKKDYSFEGYDPFNNAKFSTANGYTMGQYHVSLEGGEDASLHVYRIGVEDENAEKTIDLGSIYHNVSAEANKYSGKATCFMPEKSSVCYVAMGANGFKAVDIHTQEILMESEATMLKHGNTNGITADTKYIYMANGSDGVVICEIPDYQNSDETIIVKPLYLWDDGDDGASANFVQAYDDLIFVAKGASGGLKVIKTEIN